MTSREKDPRQQPSYEELLVEVEQLRAEVNASALKALKSVTINTQAYFVPAYSVDKRSESIVASQDMHIVAIEHFIGG